MVREPVRDVARDGIGCNPTKLRLLRKWYAMVRDLPHVLRGRVSDESHSRIDSDERTESEDIRGVERNDLDREPSRTSPEGGAAAYRFTRWPTAEESGVRDEDLLHRWEERVAISTIDGGLDEQEGRRLAWEDLLGTRGWDFANRKE